MAVPEAIRRYFDGVNTENWDDFRGIWHDDAVVEVVGVFDESLKPSEDYDFQYRVSSRYPIGLIPEVGWRKRIHEASMSSNQLNILHYKIVTRTRPFQGDSDYSIMAAHLRARLQTNRRPRRRLGMENRSETAAGRAFSVVARRKNPAIEENSHACIDHRGRRKDLRFRKARPAGGGVRG